MARSQLKLGPRKLRNFSETALCDTSIEPVPVPCRRQQLQTAAGVGRFSSATQAIITWGLLTADTDSAMELELDPTPCTAVVDVKPSVSVCVSFPSATASPLALAIAELPTTNACTSMNFWMSTCS